MKKKSVFSLENSNIKSNENLLIGSQWVFETNKSNLKDLKYDVFSSQSSKKKQRVSNTLASSKIYEAVLKDLSKKLNSIHNVNLNFKAWKILLGHWVRRFVDLCFQRDNLIKEILKTQEIDQIYGVKCNKYNLHSKDSLSIYFFSRDLLWNNIIIFKLLQFYNYENINLNFQEKNFDMNAENLQKEYSSKNYKISFPKKIIFFFFNILKIFRKNNEALITGSGLPFFYEKLLELLFFQFPKHYENKKIEYSDYNIEKRLRLKFDQTGESNQKNIQNL